MFESEVSFFRRLTVLKYPVIVFADRVGRFFGALSSSLSGCKRFLAEDSATTASVEPTAGDVIGSSCCGVIDDEGPLLSEGWVSEGRIGESMVILGWCVALSTGGFVTVVLVSAFAGGSVAAEFGCGVAMLLLEVLVGFGAFFRGLPRRLGVAGSVCCVVSVEFKSIINCPLVEGPVAVDACCRVRKNILGMTASGCCSGE